MHSIFGLLPLLLAFANGADHDTFKDCSRVDFCSTLRERAPQDKYNVDISTLTVAPSGEVQFVLQAIDNSPNLTVSISILENNRFRLQAAEVNSSRYQLQYVLADEPALLRAGDLKSGDNFRELALRGYNAKIIISPFSIEFYLRNQLQVVFNGSRLTFEEDLEQAFAFGVWFPRAVQLYGIHEHADSLALQTTAPGGTDPYRLRNLDVAGYELNSPMALYGAVPVLYGQGTNGTAGIFVHNAAEQWYEINNEDSSAYVMVESGALDLFVLLGPTPVEVVRQYVNLTGTAHLPQLWTLGHHQCRWSYMTQDDVKDVVANFVTYDFPLDAIWLDIDYTDGKKYFTWNPENFSDPIELQQNISATNKKLVTIIDPHIKIEAGYNVYEGAAANNLFVTTSNGSNFEGICWPGLSSYIDFLNPEARDYYASFYSYDKFENSTSVLAGIWNDMNEPSVFDDSLEKTLPGDALHHGGVVHRDIHNIYGFLQTKSTHQGLLNRDDSAVRPFILTRSHFAGSQRYTAIWTGDNTADWGYLSVSYDECLNANLLGLVFCGADVGGFDGEPSVELLQRWYQAGAWLPFYRAHAALGTARREPYLFDKDVQEVIRNAIQLRYVHIPAWYTLFYEHTRYQDPIIRPLFYHYPAEEGTYRLRDHLLVGSDILVRAIAEPGVDSVEVYFPGGHNEKWLRINSTQVYDGKGLTNVTVNLNAIPVFYRRGSIVTRKDEPRLNTADTIDDEYTLYVSLDENFEATGTLYMDDYISFDYVTKKVYRYLRVEAADGMITFTDIDDSSKTDKFEFSVGKIVVNTVVSAASQGKHGSYKTSVFTTDANKKPLKNYTFSSHNSVSIKLSDTN